MSKSKRRCQGRRILAMILAIVIAVNALPATAFAEPADDSGTSGSYAESESFQQEESTAAASDGAEDDSSGSVLTEADGVSNSSAIPQADPDPSTDESSTTVYQIITDRLETQAAYTGRAVFDLSRIGLQKTRDGRTEEVDAPITCIWKIKETDGSYTPMAEGTEPVNAGSYQAVFSFAEEGVHDGTDITVNFVITKASVEIRLQPVAVEPGTDCKDVKKAELSAAQVITVPAASDSLSGEDITLAITGVRRVFDKKEVGDGEKLKKNEDYVLDVKPAFREDVSEARKAVYANYDLPETVTGDVLMGDMIETKVHIAVSDKWPEGIVSLKPYDGKPAEVPVSGQDYTCEVQYLNQGVYAKLDNAGVEGSWVPYGTGGDCFDQNGNVAPPTDAGEYFYRVAYPGEPGEYASSYADIPVVIEPASVTVEISNAEIENKCTLKVTANTELREVLSKVTYKAYSMDREGRRIDIDVSRNHIWGTGYNDANVTQVYEPLFVLQVREKDGDAWKDIEDADYRLESGRNYRVIYNGKKAIYNADGTYSHRTGINSGLGENREEIHGADPNYLTDETPTADGKALVLEVSEGVRAELDISRLLQDGKAGGTPETAAREYDGQYLYGDRSAYKDLVVLKAGSKTLPAVGGEFTYTWYKSDAEDLLEKQIWEENREQGFADVPDFEDGSNWQPYRMFCPKDAGIYKLVISYEDQTDDGTFYYIEEPAVAYYVIHKRQIKVVPKGTYDIFLGRTIAGFFRDNEMAYDISGLLEGWSADVSWLVKEKISTDSQNPVENIYNRYDESATFKPAEEQAAYLLQADAVSVTNGSYDDSSNYTCYAAEIAYNPVDGRQEAYRLEKSLNDTAVINVKPTGSARVTVAAVDASKVLTRVYDGMGFAGSDVDALVRVTVENGQEIPVSGLEMRYYCELAEDGEIRELEACSDAGDYEIYADFEGDGKYAPLENMVRIGTGRITKRPITVAVKLPASCEAGGRAGEIADAVYGNITVSGYADEEEALFRERYDADSNRYVLDAWRDGPAFLVYEKGNGTPLEYDDILHRNRSFEVCYDPVNSHLSSYCTIGDEEAGTGKRIAVARNYEVTTAEGEALVEFTAVTGSSGIESVGLGSLSGSGVSKAAIADPEISCDKEGNITQTVRILEGISYSSYIHAGGKLTGNLIAFRITAPEEFGGRLPDTAMYENEVEKNGGQVVESDKEQGYFTVLFDAGEGSKTFQVRWEDGYFETFVLSFDAAQLLGNLEDAVAPKSLAYNGPVKKMAAGSSQQLDVKITKAQMGDIISLGYESSDDQVLYVNATGRVTALKKGKAVITVYARHMDKTGEMVPIMDASGKKYAKSAKLVINVTALTAPEKVKVSAHGTYADLTYSTPADGYRREIYVVDNQANPGLKKAADIEKKVKAMTNSQWKDVFAIAPVYQDSADEILNRSRNQYTARLTGLKTTGQYTVYVRNVCAAVTLEDGCVITRETVDGSAVGTAVSFRTGKAENLALHLQITDLSRNSGTVEGITDLGQRKDSNGYDIDGHRYRIEFSKIAKGSVDCLAFGEFAQNVRDPAAEEGDRMMRPLPLGDKRHYGYYDSNDKNYYEEPKLEYAVNCWNKATGRYEWLRKNEFASIDKKGKIKLTGVTGESSSFTVRVRDAVTGHYTYAELYIVADVDSVTAKKKSVNLSVGQEAELYDSALYIYKAGKKKLTGYRWPDMDYDQVRDAIREQRQEDCFELDESGILRATGAGGRLELALTDKTVEKNTGSRDKATVKMTFRSTALTPVRKLKAYDVIHDRFGLTFIHTGGADAFRIEITDAGGRKIYDRRHEIYDESIHGRDMGYKVFAVYDDNNRVKDTYRVRAEDIRDYGKLAKESRYTVRVTALYGAVSSKAASVKVKTTKIPVQDWYLDPKTPVGGMEISVSEGNRTLRYGDGRLHIVSGNSYTLTAVIENARGRVGDTLTWSVSDGKTAGVRAAAGSCCATLRGLKPGQTILEVKSRILGKKVIARYEIDVVAVGDAYKQPDKRYYGENEPEDWEDAGSGNGSDSGQEYLPLGVNDLRKVTAGAKRSGQSDGLFCFTAPEAGGYRFMAIGYQNYDASVSVYKKERKDAGWSAPDRSGIIDLGWLKEGETVYLKSCYSSNHSYYTANNTYYVGVEFTQRMKPLNADGTTTVVGRDGYHYFEFTAPEDGCYQFSAVSGQGQSVVLYLYTDEQGAIGNRPENSTDYGNTVEYFVGEGDAVWMTASLDSGQEYTFRVQKVSIDMTLGNPSSFAMKPRETKYVTFRVPQDGYYRFSCGAEPADADMLYRLHVNGRYDGADTMLSSACEMKKVLKQGDSVCLEITNNEDIEVTVSVAIDDVTPTGLPEQNPEERLDIPAGSDVIYQYTVPEAGAYKFTMIILDAGNEDKNSVEIRIWDSISDVESGIPLASAGIASVLSGTTPDGNSSLTAFCHIGMSLRAGQTVYIQGVNRLGRDLKVSIEAEKEEIPELKAGGEENRIEIQEVYASYWQMFTAPEAGIYTFASDGGSTGIRFRLYRDGVYRTTDNGGELVETVDGRLSRKVLLSQGQTVVWLVRLEEEPYSFDAVSMSVVLTEPLKELQTGAASTASVEAKNGDAPARADGFLFRAPSEGYYTFRAEGSQGNCAWLFAVEDVDADTCLLYNKHSEENVLACDDNGTDGKSTIIWELKKGETVYLKISGYDEYVSDTFPVYVEPGAVF